MAETDFLDRGPSGGSFTVNGRTYYIHPRVLGGKATRLVRRKIAELNRAEFSAIVNQTNLQPNLLEVLARQYKQETSIGFSDIMRAVQIPEVVATFLLVGCDEFNTYDEAMQVVDDHPNFAELMATVLQATGLETLKNSKAPATESSAPGASESEPSDDAAPRTMPTPPTPPRSLN